MEEFTTISIYSLAFYPSKETIKLNSYGGYRARKGDPISDMFVRVRFKKETIITGVATQGYGNADVQEWIKTYFVTFNRQKSREEEFLLDKHGKPKVKHLWGNKLIDLARSVSCGEVIASWFELAALLKMLLQFHKKNNTRGGDKHCEAMHIK